MIETRHLFSLTAFVAPILDLGECPAGTRRVVPILGGSFSGERLSGKLLQGGSDLQLVRADGVAELNVHAALETDAGDRILLRGLAIRHAKSVAQEKNTITKDKISKNQELVYFREAMIFETSSKNISWMNNFLALATGRRLDDRVLLEVFEII